jgi:hypothetical protein
MTPLPRSSIALARLLQPLKLELTNAGYRHTHTTVSATPSQGGIYYAHPDGRRAVIRATPDLKIFYLDR